MAVVISSVLTLVLCIFVCVSSSLARMRLALAKAER